MQNIMLFIVHAKVTKTLKRARVDGRRAREGISVKLLINGAFTKWAPETVLPSFSDCFTTLLTDDTIRNSLETSQTHWPPPYQPQARYFGIKTFAMLYGSPL